LTAQSKRHENFVPVKVNGKLNQNLEGYWNSTGNGYIIDASPDSLLLYCYTNNWYEVSGINPDIELLAFNKDDIFESHKTAVSNLLKMIEE
jgi:hypothetical protein